MRVPRHTVALIGREREVDAVRSLVAEHPLVTILGPGGVGKTSLAIQVATLEQNDRQVVAYVDLAPTYSSNVGDTVAATVGAVGADDESPLDAIGRALGDTELLLVLDNAEHVARAVAELASTLRAGCPSVTVLATSQVPIGVPGRGTSRWVRWPANPAERPSTFSSSGPRRPIRRSTPVRICAPSLSSARRSTGSRWRSSWLLGVFGRSTPARYSNDWITGCDSSACPTGIHSHVAGDTLGSVIAWSCDLLDPSEKRLLVRLGAFRGPFTLASAEAIVGFDPIETWEVSDHLDQLLRRSLVTVEGRGPLRRYRLLESIAAFAAERLSQANDDREVRERHARHYLGMLVDLDPANAATVDALDLESTNVRAAVAWSAANDPAPTARLLIERYRMLRVLGWYRGRARVVRPRSRAGSVRRSRRTRHAPRAARSPRHGDRS